MKRSEVEEVRRPQRWRRAGFSSIEPGSQGPGDTINLLEICQFVLQAQGYKVISLDKLRYYQIMYFLSRILLEMINHQHPSFHENAFKQPVDKSVRM